MIYDLAGYVKHRMQGFVPLDDGFMGQQHQPSVTADAADIESNASSAELAKPIKTWKGYIWDTWDLPKDQRWLLFKLDAVVLTFASVSEQCHTKSSC